MGLTENRKYNRVFISYAVEDFDHAADLYHILKSSEFEPWMDKKSLLPGQRWELEIEKSLRQSDFIIVVLSSTSVSKRGMVQREFARALEFCEEKLDSDIYIIPVKINNCDVPTKLQKFQWIEYGTNEAYLKVLEALRMQQRELIASNPRLSGTDFSYTFESVKGELGSLIPKQTYEIEFPIFLNEHSESLCEINQLFRGRAVEQVLNSRANYYSYLKDLSEEDRADLVQADHSHYEKISVSHINAKWVSFESYQTEYTGGAHGFYGSQGLNYFLDPLRPIVFEDWFEHDESALKVIRDVVYRELLILGGEMYGDSDTDFATMFGELKTEWKEFGNYYFTDDSIVFIYNPYHLTPYMMGSQQVQIKFTELLRIFPSNDQLKSFIEMSRF